MFFLRKLAIAAVAVSAIGTMALSQPVDEPIRVMVTYSDLDIGHAPGAAILLSRLDAAAKKACGGEPDIRVLAERAAFEKCRTSALSQAVAQVNAPILSAMAAHVVRPIIVAHR
ncbi:MAG TPA: UrcA family protein [Caulobacteraceae bacterium]|nr:UrcA family protein [Caulobacteraceae bacterium]